MPTFYVEGLFESHLTSVLRIEGMTVSVKPITSNPMHEKCGRLYLHTGIMSKGNKDAIQVYLSRTGEPPYKSDLKPEKMCKRRI